MKIKILFICYFILIAAQAQNTKKYFIPYQLSGKWGYADTLGNIYLKPDYDLTSINPNSYSDTRFIVAKDKKYGVVDHQNRIIIPFEYDYISMEYLEDYKLQLFITEKNKKKGLYNSEGLQLLDTKDDEITFFNKYSYKEKANYSEPLYIIVDRGDKSGVYSYTVSTRKFKELIPVLFSKDSKYKIGEGDFYLFTNTKEYYVLDRTGLKKITKEQYETMNSDYGDKKILNSTNKGAFFYKFIIKNNQIFRLKLIEGKWNRNAQKYIIDTLGEKSLPIKYKQAFLFNLKTDILNTSPKFKDIENILILNNGKKNAILSPLQIDKPIEYLYTQIDTLFTKELLASGYPLIKAYKDKKWGVVNANDSIEVSFNYDDIFLFYDSKNTIVFRDNNQSRYYGFIVKDKDKYYVLDQNHNYLYNYPFTEYKYFQKKEQIRGGFYIFNGDKKGIVYEMYLANKPIQLFKTKYPKKYRLEIEKPRGYILPIALIKVYDENNIFLGYADAKGINYWGK